MFRQGVILQSDSFINLNGMYVIALIDSEHSTAAATPASYLHRTRNQSMRSLLLGIYYVYH